MILKIESTAILMTMLLRICLNAENGVYICANVNNVYKMSPHLFYNKIDCNVNIIKLLLTSVNYIGI